MKLDLKKIFIAIIALFLIFVIYNVTISNKTKTYTFGDLKGAISRTEYSEYDGEGVKVAVIDNAINFDVLDINYLPKVINFVTAESLEPVDDAFTNHGTNIAKIINTLAPKTEIVSVVALDESGNGEISDIVKAIQWCIDNDIDIVNMSFSINLDYQELKAAIERLQSQNIIVVASYTNNVSTFDYPAMYIDVVGVKYYNGSKIRFFEGAIDIPQIVETSELDIDFTGNSYATSIITGIISLVNQKANLRGDEINYKSVVNSINNIFMLE